MFSAQNRHSYATLWMLFQNDFFLYVDREMPWRHPAWENTELEECLKMKKSKKATFGCSLPCRVLLNCFQAWNSIRIKSSKCICVYTLYIQKHSLMKDWHALTKDQTSWRIFRGSNARETSFFCGRHQFTLHSIHVPLSCSFEAAITVLHRYFFAETFLC